MQRVLIVSPHFPPDTMAGAHRMRLLAPHLERYGWRPTVVTVDPRDYEGRLDPDLAKLVDPHLDVVRCRAWPARWTRRLGMGDLGLRSFVGLHLACGRLLRKQIYKAMVITLFPAYPALLGPLLNRRYHVPFVLDYQDPWVSAWGLTVGSGRGGGPDWKSRLTRSLALRLEPWAVHQASAITAVSCETYEQILKRNPDRSHVPCAAIPLGGEPRDFETLRVHPRKNPWFDTGDGLFHLCYVGTLLPLGFETLRAVFRAAACLRDNDPLAYSKLRMYFFGTSNQTAASALQRVIAVAQEIGVADRVTEVAARVDYLDALMIQMQASALLLMGSSERHYTASKLYPALLSQRPLLAVYHSASSVVDILRELASDAPAALITYDDEQRAEARIEEIFTALRGLIRAAAHSGDGHPLLKRLREFSAEVLAGRLASVLDAIAGESCDIN